MYQVVESFDLRTFQSKVEAYLHTGWECQGGVSHSQQNGYMQAMIKCASVAPIEKDWRSNRYAEMRVN